MLRKLFIALTIGCGTAASASVLTPQQAWARVAATASGAAKAAPALKPRLLYSDPDSSYYAFSSGGSTLIVGADTRLRPVLAELPGGFDPDGMAPAAAAWLDECTAAMAAAPLTRSVAAPSLPELYNTWEPVSPIVTTKWNQDTPYNDACPEVDGKRCMTGCVATAMAQILKTNGYYQGNGSKTYTSETNALEVTFDYASADFDFATMPDVCSAETADAEKSAVASLMLACGVGVSMDYGPQSSGAISRDVRQALIEWFGYPAEAVNLFRRHLTLDSDWESIIYAEIKAGRPVYYAGSNASGGHAFVIDGYSEQGLFHVNWGWGGLSDGYYALSVLDPNNQGIGGSSAGYADTQLIVTATPPADDATPGLATAEFSGSMTYLPDSENPLKIYLSAYGTELSYLRWGFMLTTPDGEVRQATQLYEDKDGIPLTISGSYITFKCSRFSGVEPGAYRLYPAYALTADGEFEIAAPTGLTQHYVDVTIGEDGAATYANPAFFAAKLKMMEASAAPADNLEIIAGMINDGGLDVNADVKLRLTPVAGGATVDSEVLHLILSRDMNAEVCFKFPTAPIAGAYEAGIVGPDGNPLSVNTIYIGLTVNDLPWDYTGAPRVLNTSTIPDDIQPGAAWSHRPRVYFSERDAADWISASLSVTFYDPADGSVLESHAYVKCQGKGTATINNESLLTPFNVDLPFGIYTVAYTNTANGDRVSPDHTLRICTTVDGISYAPLPDGSVEVAGGAYEGDVTIPAEIEIDGRSCPVTAIGDHAFSGCAGLTSLVLPESITAVGRNALAYCSSLTSVTFNSDRCPVGDMTYVAPGLNQSAVAYVPAESLAAYSDVVGKTHEVRAISGTTSIADTELRYSPADPAIIYDTTGRRLSSAPSRGFYIINQGNKSFKRLK